MDRRRRPEADGGIDIVHAEAAGLGIGIGNARLHADAIANLQMRNTRANLDHRASRLMTKHHRRIDDERADAAMGVVMHIRSADADRMDLDLHLARSDLLWQVDVTKRQLMLTLQYQGTHLAHHVFLFQK